MQPISTSARIAPLWVIVDAFVVATRYKWMLRMPKIFEKGIHDVHYALIHDCAASIGNKSFWAAET